MLLRIVHSYEVLEGEIIEKKRKLTLINMPVGNEAKELAHPIGGKHQPLTTDQLIN